MRQRLPENRVYEAALELFARYGYKKATLGEIAAEFNMTGASMYSYAGSKQEMYRICVEYAVKKWQSYMASSVEDIDDAEQYFMTLCNSAIEYLKGDTVFGALLKRDPDILSLLHEDGSCGGMSGDAYLLIRNALQKGVKSGVFSDVDIDKCTKVFLTLFTNVIISSFIKDDAEEAMADLPDLLHVVLYGLMAR